MTGQKRKADPSLGRRRDLARDDSSEKVVVVEKWWWSVIREKQIPRRLTLPREDSSERRWGQVRATLIASRCGASSAGSHAREYNRYGIKESE